MPSAGGWRVRLVLHRPQGAHSALTVHSRSHRHSCSNHFTLTLRSWSSPGSNRGEPTCCLYIPFSLADTTLPHAPPAPHRRSGAAPTRPHSSSSGTSRASSPGTSPASTMQHAPGCLCGCWLLTTGSWGGEALRRRKRRPGVRCLPFCLSIIHALLRPLSPRLTKNIVPFHTSAGRPAPIQKPAARPPPPLRKWLWRSSPVTRTTTLTWRMWRRS